MNYKEISDKWKVFLAENAFKEDIVIKPEKKKNRKKDKKEIIVSEKEKCMDEGSGCMEELDEFEEFQDESVINEPSGSEGYNDNALEEMSAMSAGAVSGYAGNAFDTKEKVKRR